jgi:serine/threonine protein kinase/transposase
MKTAAPLPAGTLLANGRYQLQQVLGQGGFAITYLALDTQLKRTVAIKELCPQGCIRDAHNQVAPITLPPDQFAQIRQRFVEEAQLVAQLNHPGIVRIYDVFQQNNTGYMVMEYLHGETLGAKLKRAGGVLPVDEAVDYILQVCDALEVVHRAGYIHRDIKPDNIIHCEDDRLVLIDFGAARHFVANQTATYTVMLTPSYAAPEQYSSAGRLDPRTDIYGLAATLYHLVTGVPPLPALDRTSGFDLPPPHLVEPEVGEALSDAILQGLAMRMDERPASVAEFAQLINEALEEDLQPPASVPSSAQPPPASVPSSAQPPPASVPSSAQSPPASVPPPAQSPPMPQPSRHASAWESVWKWIQEDAWLVSPILLFTLFLIARPFVSELISPTVIELSPEDSQETIIKAFERIRPEGTIRLESGSYYIDKNIVIKKPLKLIGISGSVFVATNHKSLIFRAERLSSNCRASGILSAMETITRKPYETDLTDDEWAILEPVLKRALYGDKTKTRGHPRHYPLREIVNAILYVLKTGCQWRNLPHDLPPWKTVYYHFRRWEKRGVLAQIRDTLVEQARAQAGKAAPKHLAVDSQSVPSTAKGGHAGMTGARR